MMTFGVLCVQRVTIVRSHTPSPSSSQYSDAVEQLSEDGEEVCTVLLFSCTTFKTACF